VSPGNEKQSTSKPRMVTLAVVSLGRKIFHVADYNLNGADSEHASCWRTIDVKGRDMGVESNRSNEKSKK